MPSNIPGLTFSDPIAKTQELSSLLRPTNDVVIALTHIGFTENPASVEVDANVDTNLVAQTTGLDAVIGGHSHTNPATGFGNYKYLPTSSRWTRTATRSSSTMPTATTTPWVRSSSVCAPLGGGDYEVVSQTGQLHHQSPRPPLKIPPSRQSWIRTLPLFTTYNNTILGSDHGPARYH